MDNTKDNSYYISKIVKDLAFLIKHTQGISRVEMDADEVLLDSILFRLVQISENSLNLTDEFKREHSVIPWTAIKGLRNRIVHDYGKVDLGIIYSTVVYDVPEMYEYLKDFG